MPRRVLAPAVEVRCRNRQRRFEENMQWTEQEEYYKKCSAKAAAHDTFMKKKCDEKFLQQWLDDRSQEDPRDPEEILYQRREKLRKLFFKEEQENLLEIQCIPKSYHRFRTHHHYKLNETPTEVLQHVNLGLKYAEEERRRHDAELKLYQQWRNENPQLRNCEAAHKHQVLKLAWLDQQIRKRMEEDKRDEEMRNTVEEQARLVEEDKRLEKLERENIAKREQELMDQINIQLEIFKVRNSEAALFKKQEESIRHKLIRFEDIIKRNNEEIKQRRNQEIALHNIKQTKLKLKQKALDVEEQLLIEKNILEEIIASKAVEEIQNEDKRNKIKNTFITFINYFRKQQQLEKQRQNCIDFVFDSECQNMWNQMEKIWNDEQAGRDRLFQEVLSGIKDQIEERFKRNIIVQRNLLTEREELLQTIEDQHQAMKKTVKEMQERQLERKLGLDKQLTDKALYNMQEKMQEEKRQREELDDIRRDEEKLKYELMKLQTRQIPCIKYKRTLLW